MATEQYVEPFACNAFAQLLLALLLTQVRQQIRDREYRVIRVFADVQGDLCAVLADDDPVQRQWQRHPLILLDAAVVVCIEQRHTAFFIQRPRFQVETRRVGVPADDAHALCDRPLADMKQDQRLPFDRGICLDARLQPFPFRHDIVEVPKPVCFCQGDTFVVRFAFRLDRTDEAAILVPELIDPLAFRGCDVFPGIIFLNQQVV
jgi:hypothetical protein